MKARDLPPIREKLQSPCLSKEAVAPVDLVSILAGEESDTHTPPKDFDLSALVPTDSKQSNLESRFITADPADLSVSPSPSANGNMPYRKSDAQLSLPSDKLLASLSHSGALPANQENKTSANGSRNHQEPDSSAVHGDDFSKKARELFGTNGVARNEPEAARDNSPILIWLARGRRNFAPKTIRGGMGWPQRRV